MDCPRCRGLMIEELVVDWVDMEPVVEFRCLNCGHIQYPQSCCDTTHEISEPSQPVVGLDRACKWCGNPFKVKYRTDTQAHCSRACGMKSVGRSQKGRPRFMGAVPQ